MQKIPTHLAIILDGNGRWAKKRGLPRTAGHLEGAKNLEKMAKAVKEKGIKYLTVFCFSTENWNRPAGEVSMLMNLFHDNLMRDASELAKAGIRLHFIGERARFGEEMAARMGELEEQTKNNDDFHIVLALNYGGRAEIAAGVRKIAQKVKEGGLRPEEIDERTVSENLWTAGIPPVDLLIRTGGDLRISNFLLWQLAYAELYFPSVPWPAFNEEELEKALDDFTSRDRRFGAIKES